MLEKLRYSRLSFVFSLFPYCDNSGWTARESWVHADELVNVDWKAKIFVIL